MQSKKFLNSMLSNYNFVLSSASPRRRDILQSLGAKFRVVQPQAAENWDPHLTLKQNLLRIAREKCESNLTHDSITIGVDTIVFYRGKILGKPRDETDALNMLRMLSGKTHTVYSAICLGIKCSQKSFFYCGIQKTRVTFRKLNDTQIHEYLSKIHYLDKAGAYAAQEYGELIIKKIKGERENVIGFPVSLFFKLLKKMDKTIRKRCKNTDSFNK